MTEKTLKLAVYGDSFADPHRSPGSLHNETKSWTHYLVESMFDDDLQLKEPLSLVDGYRNFARNGSSIWYSYNKFMNDLDLYDHIENVVFVYTSVSRAPISEYEWAGESYDGDLSTDYCAEIDNIRKPWYKLLALNHNVSKIFAQGMFDSINRLCALRNINLLNVLAFYDTNEHPNSIENIDYSYCNYPVLSGLQRISFEECGNYDSFIDITDKGTWITSDKSYRFDPRFCHLNERNNKLLADTIHRMLIEKRKQIVHFNDLSGIDKSKQSWSKYNTDLSAFNE